MTANNQSDNPSRDEALDSVVDQMDSDGAESPEQIVDLLEQQVAQYRDRELKAQAELENFRKRLLRDTEQQLKYASVGLVRDLLDVVDNLNRATEAAVQSGEAGGLVEGVKLVLHQMTGVLDKHHCKPIPALGQPFDPNVHQAIAQQPSAEYAAGVVMMETSVGYTLHDRVIRPSMVIVSTGAAN
ncbi:nucleotide exchange factor GrpE [Pirellulaceae bacterium SH501]